MRLEAAMALGFTSAFYNNDGDFVIENRLPTSQELAAIDAKVIELELEMVAQTERDWRDKELASTDVKMIQANAGELGRDKVSLKAFRQALRDYPAQADFPNGTRPKP